MSQLHPVIGIDLGTTYSAVAAFNTDLEKSIILSNPENKKPTTPSIVSYDRARNLVLVGAAAKRNLAMDPANTIQEIKREMGELFRPETLAKFDPKGIGGFRAKEDRQGGYPGDPVKARFSGEWYLPQEISALILMKMKWIAEQSLGTEIRDAVITVPAYFKEKQRKATEEAALLAGLYPRQLIPEPTAAAICYGVDKFEPSRKVYLVYDLGGGTFDVSIISVEEEKIDVLATSGDPRLGGGDFDDAVTRWAVAELYGNHQLDVRNDPRAQSIIKYYAEQLKIQLSTYEQESISLPELRPDRPPSLTLSRGKFVELINSDLDKSLNYVDIALRAAETQKGVRRNDIDAILLVGGSSKIPHVKHRLLEYFQREPEFVRADLDADAVVARGAAILAKRYQPTPPPFDIMREIESSQQVAADDELELRLITEHSLGVAVVEDGQLKVSRIVNQGTGIPVSVTRGGFANAGPTDFLFVQVYQGEGTFIYENDLIGEVRLGPMEPKPEGQHKFEVRFTLDRSGLLTAIVNHVNENQVYKGEFKNEATIGGKKALVSIRDKMLRLYDPNREASAMLATSPGAATSGPVPGVQPPPNTAPPSPYAATPADAAGSPQAPTHAAPPGSPPPPYSSPPAPYATPSPSGGPQGYPPPPAYNAPPPPYGGPGPYSPPAYSPPPYAPPPTQAPTSGGYPPAPSHYSPPPQPAPWQAPPTATTSPAGPTATDSVPGLRPLAPHAQVPEQFKSVWRRVQKQLLKAPNARLLQVANKFADGLNGGLSGSAIEEIGDELEEAYLENRS